MQRTSTGALHLNTPHSAPGTLHPELHMSHTTNLYGGWWVYAGLIGVGLILLALSTGSLGIPLLAVAGLVVAAVWALRRGLSPRRALTAELSADGLTLLDHPRPLAGWGHDLFLTWDQVIGVRLTPKPGYWQTSVQTTVDPERWLLTGHSLALAEDIASVAGLVYDEAHAGRLQMGVEHTWSSPRM